MASLPPIILPSCSSRMLFLYKLVKAFAAMVKLSLKFSFWGNCCPSSFSPSIAFPLTSATYQPPANLSRVPSATTQQKAPNELSSATHQRLKGQSKIFTSQSLRSHHTHPHHLPRPKIAKLDLNTSSPNTHTHPNSPNTPPTYSLDSPLSTCSSLLTQRYQYHISHLNPQSPFNSCSPNSLYRLLQTSFLRQILLPSNTLS
mmetsp:Transcript_4979/g.6943  ORF Transcript_4979/g.6943 Transcript_4979/m.6943 type:complete len:201 (-) Transcript_4979:60-662(-)